jgi:hypothetical protein
LIIETKYKFHSATQNDSLLSSNVLFFIQHIDKTSNIYVQNLKNKHVK